MRIDQHNANIEAIIEELSIIYDLPSTSDDAATRVPTTEILGAPVPVPSHVVTLDLYDCDVDERLLLLQIVQERTGVSLPWTAKPGDDEPFVPGAVIGFSLKAYDAPTRAALLTCLRDMFGSHEVFVPKDRAAWLTDPDDSFTLAERRALTFYQ